MQLPSSSISGPVAHICDRQQKSRPWTFYDNFDKNFRTTVGNLWKMSFIELPQEWQVTTKILEFQHPQLEFGCDLSKDKYYFSKHKNTISRFPFFLRLVQIEVVTSTRKWDFSVTLYQSFLLFCPCLFFNANFFNARKTTI